MFALIVLYIEDTLSGWIFVYCRVSHMLDNQEVVTYVPKKK